MTHIHLIKYRAKIEGVCDDRELIGMLICEEIGSAIKVITDACIPKSSDMREIVKIFKDREILLTTQTLVDMKLERPAPDKVFREIEKDGVFLLVPASNALSIVLSNNMKEKPSLTKLIELVM